MTLVALTTSTARAAAAVVTALRALKPPRSLQVVAVELAGLAAVCYGLAGWSPSAAYVAAGVGLIGEAYALERR